MEEIKKRMEELSLRAYQRGIYTESRFLTLGEREEIHFLALPLPPVWEGGFAEAERCIARFGKAEELGYEYVPPFSYLEIRPKSPKYADELTHRDFLGAILNLGIERDFLGDLLVQENVGYLVALESVGRVIGETLQKVKHTDVLVSFLPAFPETVRPQTEEMTVIAASLRLDAVVSAVFDLSRSEGKELVEKEKVTVSGKGVSNPAYLLKEGERISVRGNGRFFYDGVLGETRSNRIRIKIRKMR